MTTMFVTYTGDASTRFDRDYYVDTHLPLVRAAWGPHGLRSATAFFPAGADEGAIALAVCEFADEAAVDAALRSPNSAAVMADVATSPMRRPPAVCADVQIRRPRVRHARLVRAPSRRPQHFAVPH